MAASIELGMQQIQREIAAGRIPPTITEFSALHDYVDANEFGGLCDEDGQWRSMFPRETAADEEIFCEAVNRVQDALANWLGNSAERNALLGTNLAFLSMRGTGLDGPSAHQFFPFNSKPETPNGPHGRDFH